MIKLTITKTNPDWLEATWVEETTTTSIVENEVKGEIVQETVENTETTVLHCESFSGHPEHIAMLEAKALEFETSLEEYTELITQAKEAFVMPTAEELLAYELEQKIQEAKVYLLSTDYKMTVDYFATLSKEIQDELILKRNEAREFIRQGDK